MQIGIADEEVGNQTTAKWAQRAAHHQSGIAIVGLGNHTPIVEKNERSLSGHELTADVQDEQ